MSSYFTVGECSGYEKVSSLFKSNHNLYELPVTQNDDIPVPPDVERVVSKSIHFFDWVTEKTKFTDKKLYEGKLKVVFKKVIADFLKYGTFFYNRGFREGVKFQQAVSELRRLETQIGAGLPKPDPNFKFSETIEIKVGKLINFNARSVEVAAGLNTEIVNMSFGANISYTSDRVNNYNSYLSETDEELNVRREIFAKSPNSYYLDLHYLDEHPPAIVTIRGKKNGAANIAALLDMVFYQRMKYARDYGQQPREKSTFIFG